jgi:zinc transport system substrate-binding protein
MQGVGEPALLIPGAGSPHTYVLRPSEARAIQQADAIFWVGEALETFLAKPLATLPHSASVVALRDAPGVRLLPYRTDDDGDGDYHRHAGGDMHIWLDPDNAKAIVAAVAATLSAADPGNADRYRDNAARSAAQLDELDAALSRDLANVRRRPYAVFHDAYQYFEVRYGLKRAESITIGPERQPGAQSLRRIREQIAGGNIICVFREPQFEPALVATLVEGTRARIGILDPLGADLPAGPDAYFGIMHGLARSLQDCLAAPT